MKKFVGTSFISLSPNAAGLKLRPSTNDALAVLDRDSSTLVQVRFFKVLLGKLFHRFLFCLMYDLNFVQPTQKSKWEKDCPSCGKKVAGGDRFCPHCGGSVAAEVASDFFFVFFLFFICLWIDII